MTLRKNYGDLPNVLGVEFGQKLKLSDKKKGVKKLEKRLKDVVFSHVWPLFYFIMALFSLNPLRFQDQKLVP